MTTSLDAALVDVRKAYRLLANYQQRIIELLAFIRDEFGAVNYYYNYQNSPPRGFAGLEQDSKAGFRFLPLLDAKMLWLRHPGKEMDYVHRHMKGDVLIDVEINSDRGLTYSDVSAEARNFAEQSSSNLIIAVFHCDEPAPGDFNWYHKVWSEFDYPDDGKIGQDDDIPGYRAYRNSIPMEKLGNKEAVSAEIRAYRQRASTALGCEI